MKSTSQISDSAARAFAVAVATILLAIVGIAVDTFALHRHAKALRVGFKELSPYIYRGPDGRPVGLAVDLMNEAARRSGQTLIWLPVEDGEESLSSGKIDLFPMLGVTRERLQKFHFSEYWWQNSLELVSSERRPVTGIKDSAGKRIGLRTGGLALKLARSWFPSAVLIVKPDAESLVSSLCRGEVDALFADIRSVQQHLVDRPESCWNLRLRITSVAGGTMPVGTASTRLVRNRADVLFTHINEVLADGTLANLASSYQLAAPDSNQHLVQRIQDRQNVLLLEGLCLGLCGTLVFLAFIALRMRYVQSGIEEARLDLEESEQRFHAFMDDLAAHVFMKDSAGRLLYVNRADAKMFQMSPEECLGKTTFDLLPRAVAEQLCAHDRMVLEANRGLQFTESMPDQMGRMHHWLSFKFPFHGRSGDVFLGGVSIDITEMIEVQNALRESESRYRQIVEFAGDIIVRCDARGRISYINEMGLRVLRYTADRLRGHRALNLIPRSERRRVIEAIRQELKSGSVDLYLELPVVTGNKTELWMAQTLRVLRKNGVFSGVQAISRDITQQRKMEQDLRDSEERFRMLYENGPVAFHEIDARGIILRANRAESEMLGIPLEEFVGRPAWEFLVPEEQEKARAAIAAKAAEQKPLRPFNRTLLRRDGRRVPVEIHENLLRDESGKVVAVHSVLLDMTRHYLSEALDRDRLELSEMIVQQRPLEHVLRGISRMIGHQDESLRCIPLLLTRDGERNKLAVVRNGHGAEELFDILDRMGNEAFALWPSNEFRVSHLSIPELARQADSYAAPSSNIRDMVEAAVGLGIESCWSIPIISSADNVLGMLLVFSPRTSEVSAQERQLLEAGSRVAAIAIDHRHMTDLLSFQASHDGLTRLPNRSTFENRLEIAIRNAHAQEERLAVFYVDLDHFKEVNDTFGHSGGDELLQQVAARLRRCIRHSDLLARVGGDEFSLLLPGLSDAAEASRVAEGILQAFREPFKIGDAKLCVTASIGISFYPQDGLDATALQRHSDNAMYRVKSSGKNSFQCYAA